MALPAHFQALGKLPMPHSAYFQPLGVLPKLPWRIFGFREFARIFLYGNVRVQRKNHIKAYQLGGF